MSSLRNSPILKAIERLRMKAAVMADARVQAYAIAVLGRQQWSALRAFGKCMAGPPYGGLYISGLPVRQVYKLLRSLAAGETVAVHLMHRHRSGDYARSSLRLGPGRVLLMVYAGREVPAFSEGPELPPLHDPHVALARKILSDWDDESVAVWWRSTSSFLGGRRPRDVLYSDPLLVVAAAFNRWEWENYGG